MALPVALAIHRRRYVKARAGLNTPARRDTEALLPLRPHCYPVLPAGLAHGDPARRPTAAAEALAISRVEHDSFGPSKSCRPAVGAPGPTLLQTSTSGERQPVEIIRALALVKRASARVNQHLGLLDDARAAAIAETADEVIAGAHALRFHWWWQTGSAPRPT